MQGNGQVRVVPVGRYSVPDELEAEVARRILMMRHGFTIEEKPKPAKRGRKKRAGKLAPENKALDDAPGNKA